MKYSSVKGKITLWLTGLTVVLCLLLVVFLLGISRGIVEQTARNQLTSVMRSQVELVRCEQGQPVLAEDFQFYQHGVSVLIYSKNGTLVAGQVPVAFTAREDFENGNLHQVMAGDTAYMVLDLWVADGWESGIWLRGLLEIQESSQTTRTLLVMAAVALPLFILLAAAGSYRIIRRALRPLDVINTTADSIGAAADLSRRIGLPPGKDEFSRLGANFDRLFDRLERSFEAEKQFTADASHELRTPVTVIKSASEYGLRYAETPEEYRESLEMIHGQADKMAVLIEQLLQMTRLEQGMAPRMEPVELTGLLEELCLGYDPKRVEIRLQESVTVRGNAPLLARLAGNLIDNALKYSGPEGQVWVMLTQSPEETLLSVRDNGVGIPAEAQEKVWQRFFQVDPARGDAQTGAGLGLSMVRQIAELHGGYMTLESTPGQGSCFSLHLPKQV